jgi:hypothetical protein
MAVSCSDSDVPFEGCCFTGAGAGAGAGAAGCALGALGLYVSNVNSISSSKFPSTEGRDIFFAYA